MTTAIRLPQIDLVSLLTHQNPQIDLRIPAYETSTRNFLKAVSSYKNRAIATISDRRVTQAAEKKKVADKVQLVEAETNQCKVAEIALVADLEREQEERKDAELSVAAFKRRHASLRDKCSSIDAEIEQYRAITANLHREKKKERSTLGKHAARVSPELDALEQRLCCVVEGIEKNQILVRFSHVDSSEPEREFSFVVDVSTNVYKVLTSTPLLPTLPILVEELNDSRDIYGFVKQVRRAFENLVTDGS